MLPWSFLIAGITNVLLFAWILIYILALYKDDDNKVVVPRIERDEDANTEAGESGTKITYTK